MAAPLAAGGGEGAQDGEDLAFMTHDELNAAPPPPLDDGSNNMSGNITLANMICRSAHPVAAFFHVFFKISALLVYIFCGWFTDRFVLVFVLLVLLLAFDFWTVKNVTGRLLVGLRWWNNMKPDGTSEWVFESHQGTRDIHPLDYRIFWGALILTPALWILFGVFAALRNLQWLVIVVVAVSLNGANVVGYVKCSNEAKNKLKNAVAQGALSALTRNTSLFGLGGNGNNGAGNGGGAAADNAAGGGAPSFV